MEHVTESLDLLAF